MEYVEQYTIPLTSGFVRIMSISVWIIVLVSYVVLSRTLGLIGISVALRSDKLHVTLSYASASQAAFLLGNFKVS